VSRLLNYIYPWVSTNHILGSFNPGVQPRGTPITAEVVHGGDVDINVMWRDARGRTVTGSWSKSSGWDLPINGSLPLDGQDWGIFAVDCFPFFYFGCSHQFNVSEERTETPKWPPSGVVSRKNVPHNIFIPLPCVLLDLRATSFRILKLHLGDTTLGSTSD